MNKLSNETEQMFFTYEDSSGGDKSPAIKKLFYTDLFTNSYAQFSAFYFF